jgi:protein TonB
MPAAAKVHQKVIPQPVLTEPVPAPPVKKIIPAKIEKFRPEPKPTVRPEQKIEATPLPAVVAVAEPVKAEQTMDDSADKLVQEKAEEIPVATLTEAGMGTAQVASASIMVNELQNYSDLIRERIEKVKRYPLMARKAGKEGTVIVEFSVNSKGDLLSSQVVSSCGTTALDKAALKALQRASPFPLLPETVDSPHRFSVQINFFLAG